MKYSRLHSLTGAAFALALSCLVPARAVDTYWTGGDGNLTNAAKWTAGVPGASDTACFTNAGVNYSLTNSTDLTVANVSFNFWTNTQAIYRGGATTLFVTNRFAVDEVAGSTGLFYFLSGNLVVTNSSRTAVFYGAPQPTSVNPSLNLLGGNLVADRFFMTNQNSNLSLGMGSLTTYAGLQMVVTAGSSSITYGSSTLGAMQVNILGGSNLISTPGTGALSLGDNPGRSGRLVVSGAGTYLSNKVATFYVGLSGYGEFVLSNGASMVNVGNTTIGNAASTSSNSFALVTGSGTYWTNTGSITVGAATNASLTISDGATVALGAASTISASGGSRTALLVTTNSTLSSNVRLTITGTGNSAPLVAVVGSNAVLLNSDLRLSGTTAGAPSVLVTNGGRWTASSAFQVGFSAGSSASVLLSGTNSMISAQSVLVGSNGNLKGSGYLLVNDAAVLEVTSGSLANGTNSTGVISNIGGVYQFNNSAPSVTTNTPGGIVLENGTISYRGVTGVNFMNNQAHLRITQVGDSTIRFVTATNLAMTAYTFQTNNPGQYAFLSLDGGGRFMATNSILVAAGSRISGNGTVESMAVTNSGTISPGNSPGLLTFTSNLTLTASSVLSMEIGGTNLGAFDRILVGGVLTKTGAVNVSLLNYNPSAGDSFDLLDWGTVLGSFAALNLPTLSGGLQWDATSFESQGILVVASAIPEPSTLALVLLAAAGLLLRRGSRG